MFLARLRPSHLPAVNDSQSLKSAPRTMHSGLVERLIDLALVSGVIDVPYFGVIQDAKDRVVRVSHLYPDLLSRSSVG